MGTLSNMAEDTMRTALRRHISDSKPWFITWIRDLNESKHPFTRLFIAYFDKITVQKNSPSQWIMKRFKIEQADINIVSHGGLALIGQAIQRYTHLSREVDTLIPLRHGTKHSDILKTYTAMLCLGKNDFEAINTLDNALYPESVTP